MNNATAVQEKNDQSTGIHQGYRDWSMEPRNEAGKSLKNNNTKFPIRLHCLINEAAKDGLQHIISWQPHGRCFAVHRQKEFVELILPLWFTQKRFESFQRQLNIYGFSRVQSGPDAGCYYHEFFLRGKDFLAHRIPRGTSKRADKKERTSNRSKVPSLGAPNFYEMPFLPDSSSPGVAPSKEGVLLPSTNDGLFLSQFQPPHLSLSSLEKSFNPAVMLNSPSVSQSLTSTVQWANTRTRASALATLSDLALQVLHGELENTVAVTSRRNDQQRSIAHQEACPPRSFAARSSPVSGKTADLLVSSPPVQSSAALRTAQSAILPVPSTASGFVSTYTSSAPNTAAPAFPMLTEVVPEPDVANSTSQLSIHPLTVGLFTNYLLARREFHK